MHASSSRRTLRFLLPFAVLASLLPVLRGADPVPTDRAPLVVTNGMFQRDGKSTLATVRNLIDFIQQRYPDTNITIIGADEVVIEQLTLQWRDRPRRDDDGKVRPMPPPLDVVLNTLAEASGRRFDVVSSGDHDFVLRGARPGGGPTATRVFNVRALTEASAYRALEEELQSLELQYAPLKKRFMAGALDSAEILPLENRIAIVKRRLGEMPKPDQELDHLLKQIREVVELTLKLSHPTEEVPEFKYHPGSGLLIAVGSEAAVDTTRMVIEAMGKKG